MEDPTVVQCDDGIIVFYTGVLANRRQGSLLLASGRDPYALTKREVVLKAPEGEGNFKEATLLQAPDGSWRLFYEFARDNASRIGMACATRLGGEWAAMKEMVPLRVDSWDNWHLSPGPIVQCPGRDPVMFYNGATNDARWRIGWVTFNRDCECITDRGVEPMLVPPPAKERASTDIAFAASAVLQNDGSIILLFAGGPDAVARDRAGLRLIHRVRDTAEVDFTVSQPFGYFSLAASSLTDGGMMTSSPGFQLTGVATPLLSVSWTNPKAQHFVEVATRAHRVKQHCSDLLVRADDVDGAHRRVAGGSTPRGTVSGVGREHVVELGDVEIAIADHG